MVKNPSIKMWGDNMTLILVPETDMCFARLVVIDDGERYMISLMSLYQGQGFKPLNDCVGPIKNQAVNYLESLGISCK